MQSPLAASLLSQLEPSTSVPGSIILLPSKHIPPPIQSSASEPLPPRTSPAYAEDWDLDLLDEATKILNSLGATGLEWNVDVARSVKGTSQKSSRKGDIGDGGMYI